MMQNVFGKSSHHLIQNVIGLDCWKHAYGLLPVRIVARVVLGAEGLKTFYLACQAVSLGTG